jgi:iron complex transport system substrate-binding protein
MGIPQRVVCLTAETTEIAFALGAGERVVGVSGYSVRPPEARRKPKVAAYTSARLDKILELQPDLILAFSDLQAEIVRDLVKAGLSVVVTNQRSLAETWEAIRLIGRVLGCPVEAEKLASDLQDEIDRFRHEAARLPRRPRVFFEEWDDPLISGIRWVGELVEAAGGEDIFPEMRGAHRAPDRVVDPAEVVRRDPEVIVASWCGKKVNPDRIRTRPGWQAITAVRHGCIHEIKSPDILQPGPSLVRGLRRLAVCITSAAEQP